MSLFDEKSVTLTAQSVTHSSVSTKKLLPQLVLLESKFFDIWLVKFWKMVLYKELPPQLVLLKSKF